MRTCVYNRYAPGNKSFEGSQFGIYNVTLNVIPRDEPVFPVNLAGTLMIILESYTCSYRDIQGLRTHANNMLCL